MIEAKEAVCKTEETIPATRDSRDKTVRGKAQIPSLNGLRAISISMVIAYHLQQSGLLPVNRFLNLFGILFFNGPLGVNVFFIISGFLITTLLKAEKEKSGWVSLRKFYIRRSIRIFPAYYVFILVLGLLQLLNYYSFPALAWVATLTYTKQFFPFYGHSVEHLWSLSVEEFFYLFWPLCFVRVKNTRFFLLALISAITLLRFFLYQYPLPLLTNSFFTTGDALLIGCLIATEINFFKNLAFRFGALFVWLPVAIYISICIYNFAYHLGVGTNSATLVLQKISYALFGSVGLVTNLIVGLYIVHCIFSKGIIYRVLNNRLLNFIGLLSYSIYLWQQLFTDDRVWLHRLPLLLILSLIFSVALLSYYGIEKPFLRLKRRFET